MAKYNVKHACGCYEIHRLYGPGASRQSRIAWLETTLCSECFKKQREEMKDREPYVVKVSETGKAYVISGNTYKIKEELKLYGFRWSDVDGMWYLYLRQETQSLFEVDLAKLTEVMQKYGMSFAEPDNELALKAVAQAQV